MPDTNLQELLERNTCHTESLESDHFDAVQDGQEPAAVAMTCADSRVSQEGMWAVEEPGWLFTPSTIGNQVWDRHEGDRVVDGSMLYPLVQTGTDVAVVVGHTGCGAVTAALEAVRGAGGELPAGILKWIQELVPVIEAGLADDRIDPDRGDLVDQLVEYNVDRQVEFLRESENVPANVSIYGFVYDFQQVYGSVPGRAYLVNADGETDLDALRALAGDEHAEQVKRLL
ncbi:carbonic anhydrase [Halodesulfurarchaeum sp. HSR-GB]|uniref:carbonic anhydrase n=1 Tax=Halodesulfurarchaeum sp. HSR-GB TaxID=3074077 RepID=UPI00286441DD|nr:carbonic anhydrase [Halodesulfurarchaeum sp. HSR-GB]MDR5655920.1 carbonic anhydrase [Halodesulfurarchaeum sp. HSR-GB]